MWTMLFMINHLTHLFFFEQTKSKFSLSPYSRPKGADKLFSSFFELTEAHPMIFVSFIIPFFLMVAFLFIRPFFRLCASASLILTLRPLIVCLTTPARNFKYQYPLWLFAPFPLFILLAERKLRLTKKA
jgi:hypothetical protein